MTARHLTPYHRERHERSQRAFFRALAITAMVITGYLSILSMTGVIG